MRLRGEGHGARPAELLSYLLEASETTAGLADDLRAAVVEFEREPLSLSSVTALLDRVKAHNGQLAGVTFELARRGERMQDMHSVRADLRPLRAVE